MEDVYTIKVKTKPDTRNLYPSERRYSASTVSGLAWVHIALAATSFLLASLALVSPNTEEIQSTGTNYTGNSTSIESNNYLLIIAPSLITIFGLAAGFASILASTRWYIDRNITWLFIMSSISTLISLGSFIMIAVWFITTSEVNISDFYKDKIPFKDLVVVKHSDVVSKNISHLTIAIDNNIEEENQFNFTKRVLSINILIAAFLELLWSVLSVKISYKGMRNNYKEEGERRGNCISVVTKIKGNDTKNLPRNGKLIPKPGLIEHYPTRKMKKLFLAQDENGFYLKNDITKTKNTDSNSELYKERMMNFLNRCASLEGVSDPEIHSTTVSDAVLNIIPEGVKETSLSWGDTPEHTVYNQNTINFDKIFKYKSEAEENTE